MGRLLRALSLVAFVVPVFLVLWLCFGTGIVSLMADGSFLYGFALIPVIALGFFLRNWKMGWFANAFISIAVLAVVLTAFGYIDTNLWKGSKKSIRATTHGIGERFTESAIQSTKYSYNMAKLKEGVVYLDISTIAVFLEKDGKEMIFPEDTEVRVLSLEPVLGGKDGTVHLIPVMLMDKRRKDYVDGPRGWVPTTRLKFDHRFPGISFAKKEKEEVKWGPVQTTAVELNDPKDQFIAMEDGRYRFWAEWQTRVQCTDWNERRGCRYREIYPDGRFTDIGYVMRNASVNPLGNEPGWAAVLKRDGNDPGKVFRQGKYIEAEVVGGVLINQNARSIIVAGYPDPAHNWIHNRGPVTVHYQRRV